MTNRESIYYICKMSFSIIFDIKESNYEYDKIYFDLVVMDYLKTVIEELTKKNLLSKKVQDNIKCYLLKARDYKDEDRKDRIDIINDVLSLLNSQEKDNSLVFYVTELYKRTNDKNYIYRASRKEIIEKIDRVHESIVSDYLILTTHNNTTSEEEFNNNFLEKFVSSDVYMESLNVLLNEMPQLFNNKVFYNRVMDVLEMKKFFAQEKSTKLEKEVNKKIKQIGKKI